jgi:hypothetical protein
VAGCESWGDGVGGVVGWIEGVEGGAGEWGETGVYLVMEARRERLDGDERILIVI